MCEFASLTDTRAAHSDLFHSPSPTKSGTAKRCKENASACTNPQKPEADAENPTSPNTSSEESKPAATDASPERNLSEENCKPQSVKMEDDVTMEPQETDEKEKEGEEREEGDSRPEPAVISQEEGKHE